MMRDAEAATVDRNQQREKKVREAAAAAEKLQLEEAAIGNEALEAILTLAFQFFCSTVVRIGHRKWNAGYAAGQNNTQGVAMVTGVKDKEDECLQAGKGNQLAFK